MKSINTYSELLPCFRKKGSLEKIWLPIPVVYNFSCQLKHPYIYLLIAPASFRPYSVVNFSHFRLLLWNCWMGFNETWQEARSQRALPILWVFFSGRGKKKTKMAALASDWLWHFRLFFWNRWTEFKETWQEAIYQCPLPSMFFGPIEKTRWPPLPLIGWDISHFSEIAERNSTKLDREQDLNVFYLVCVFRADKKNKIADPASHWLRQF